MEKVILEAQVRKGLGKTDAKTLRKQGLVPCVCYKAGKESLHLKVGYRELWRVLHTKAGENVLVTLSIADGEKALKDKTVLIKEIQHEPVADKVIHVDFNEISLTEKIQVNVPLATRGEPEGVMKEGGVLDHVLWELQVECLPMDIPQKIELEIAHMKIGDDVLVKDITPPPGIKILNDPEQIAIAIHPPHVEKPAEELAAEGAPEEPEIIKKGKKEEEVIEEEAEAKPKKEETPKPKEEKR